MDSVEAREKQFHDKVFADGSRAKVAPFYALTTRSRLDYESRLLADCQGKRVLEYGCGLGSKAFLLAERGATVVGIDISKVAIHESAETARERGLRGLEFLEMNAHELQFDSENFDLVCGSGILHHLNLERAYSEIARVLQPEGNGVFFEPLGHNPLINLYRRRTPELRTPDEHPLLIADIRLAQRFFAEVRVGYFHLTTFAALPFRKRRGFPRLVSLFDRLDQGLFRVLPFARKQAWIAVITLSRPRTAT